MTKKYIIAIALVATIVDAVASRRNYFKAHRFDEHTEKPIPMASDYRDEIGTRKHLSDVSFEDWFNGPYLMPMRRYILEDQGIVPSVSYLGNFAANPWGGFSRGAAISNNVNMDLGIDLGKLTKAKELKGFSINTTWSWRFGNSLTKERIGNAFNVQQCYGDPTIRSQALYLSYNKQIDDWSLLVKVGRIAAGDNFLSNPIYWLYQNNAFDGNPVGIFKQQKWSAYPGSTWGAFVKVDNANGAYFKAGVYKINTDEQDSPHEHGLDWSMSGDGVNANFEMGWNINHDDSGRSPGCIAVGIANDWYNVPYLNSTKTATDFSYTVYLHADYMLWNLGAPKKHIKNAAFIERDKDAYRDLRGLIAWCVVQYNPNQNTALMPLFINGGLLFNAPFESRADDVVCFGFAYGKFSNNLTTQNKGSYELALELNYKFQVNKFFFIQPNIQYINNTNGGEYPDALVLGMQFGLNL